MPLLTGLRERRRLTKVKVGAFAPMVGYSRSGYISIENGSRPASPEGAQRIADVLSDLGVPTDYEELIPTPPPKQPKRPKGPRRGGKKPKAPPKQPNAEMRAAS